MWGGHVYAQLCKWVVVDKIYVLMHVHLLTKVRGHMRGSWDTHMEPHRGKHICTQLCKGCVEDMGGEVYMHKCTDAHAHSDQDVGQGEEWQGYADMATERPTHLQTTTQG